MATWLRGGYDWLMKERKARAWLWMKVKNEWCLYCSPTRVALRDGGKVKIFPMGRVPGKAPETGQGPGRTIEKRGQGCGGSHVDGPGTECEACGLTCYPPWKAPIVEEVLSDQFNRMTWPSDINQLLSLASSLLTQRAHERNSRGGREGGSEQV